MSQKFCPHLNIREEIGKPGRLLTTVNLFCLDCGTLVNSVSRMTSEAGQVLREPPPKDLAGRWSWIEHFDTLKKLPGWLPLGPNEEEMWVKRILACQGRNLSEAYLGLGDAVRSRATLSRDPDGRVRLSTNEVFLTDHDRRFLTTLEHVKVLRQERDAWTGAGLFRFTDEEQRRATLTEIAGEMGFDASLAYARLTDAEHERLKIAWKDGKPLLLLNGAKLGSLAEYDGTKEKFERGRRFEFPVEPPSEKVDRILRESERVDWAKLFEESILHMEGEGQIRAEGQSWYEWFAVEYEQRTLPDPFPERSRARKQEAPPPQEPERAEAPAPPKEPTLEEIGIRAAEAALAALSQEQRDAIGGLLL
jgi:hypothetical protein